MLHRILMERWNWGLNTLSMIFALISGSEECYEQTIHFLSFFNRVINAGKSTHNEDQASCEVLSVKKKPGGTNSTPNKNSSTKRRSSLPNGEGLQLKENSVSRLFVNVTICTRVLVYNASAFHHSICLESHKQIDRAIMVTIGSSPDVVATFSSWSCCWT